MEGMFGGCLKVLSIWPLLLLLVFILHLTLKFLNKNGASSRHCSLSKNRFLVSNDLGALFGGRLVPSALPLQGFHLSPQD